MTAMEEAAHSEQMDSQFHGDHAFLKLSQPGAFKEQGLDT